MLVLTRSKGQSVFVEIAGQVLEVMITEVRGDKVKIGFAGPRDFDITRSENYERVKTANVESARVTPRDLCDAEKQSINPREQ
jgi:carbon storage regulator